MIAAADADKAIAEKRSQLQLRRIRAEHADLQVDFTAAQNMRRFVAFSDKHQPDQRRLLLQLRRQRGGGEIDKAFIGANKKAALNAGEV